MNPSDPENNCRSYFTFKAFPEFFTPHGPTRQALQLHPTHQQEGDKGSTPHINAGPRSTHTPMSSAAIFPSALVGFLPFLLFSHSTSLPPTSSFACTWSTKAKLSLTLAKPISPPTSPIYRSHAADETLLSNSPSTIPDPPKIDLVAAAEDRRHRWRPILLTQSLSLSQSISISLNLSLFLPPSLNLTEFS